MEDMCAIIRSGVFFGNSASSYPELHPPTFITYPVLRRRKIHQSELVSLLQIAKHRWCRDDHISEVLDLLSLILDLETLPASCMILT